MIALTSSKNGAHAARKERVPPTSYMSHSCPDSAPRREMAADVSVGLGCAGEEAGTGAGAGDGDGADDKGEDVPRSKRNRCSCTPIVRNRARTMSSSLGSYSVVATRSTSLRKLAPFRIVPGRYRER